MKKLSEKDDEFCKMIVWENFFSEGGLCCRMESR